MFRFSISSDQDIIQIIQSSFQNLIGIRQILTSLIDAFMEFGEYIRSLREKRNLLLREMAANLNMDVAYLTRIMY